MENVDDIYGLTPMQGLMLVHAVTHPRADVLVNPVAYEIRGPLDVPTLREAWRLLLARHPALRTAVLWRGLERPVQVVRGRVELPFDEVDLSIHPPAERDARWEALWKRESSRSFELGRAPLMRVTLARMDEDRHLLLWAVHHLVVDRWSEGVVSMELQEIHRAVVAGEPPRLPPPTPFRDYVAWLAERGTDEAERYWRRYLAGFDRATTVAREAGAHASAERRVLDRVLSPDTAEGLARLAAASRVPLGSVLLGGVGIAVARRLRTGDVVVGVTASGRPPGLPGVEEIVGSLVNDVPVRMRLDGPAGVADWIRGVARAQVARQPHEHLSLAAIRDTSTLPPADPLFDLLVVTNLGGASEPGAGPLGLRAVRGVLASAYPLTLGFSLDAHGVGLRLVHHASDDWATALLDDVATALADLGDAATDAPVEALVPDAAGAPAVGDLVSVEPRAGEAAGPVDLGARVLGIWREVLGVDALGLDDDFFAVGGTSLAAARIFSRIERETGRTLPLSLLVEATSVRALLSALDEPSHPEGPVVTLRSVGEGAPVYAVPGIGGGVVGLLPLSRALAPGRPFHAFQSRGYDGREEPLRTIRAIADDFAGAVPSGRIHLVGACWGAAVAFEVARLLGQRGRPPLSLSLLDPPTLLRRDDTATSSGPWVEFVTERARLYWDEFREGDWAERRALLARKARAAGQLLGKGGIPGETRSELGRRNVRSANLHAIERYAPEPLAARARIFITQEREVEGGDDPRLGWSALLPAAVRVVAVPGFDSGDAITGNVEHFAAVLREWIEEVEAAPPADS